MKLDEFFFYKNRLMKELCSSKEIVSLVTENEDSQVPNHTLAYTQIFPYEYIPETVSNASTFICFDVDIADVQNKTFYLPVLYIWVFTHKSKIRLPSGGIRTDKLCSEIDSLLNGSFYYGLGDMDLKSVGRFSPITDYQGRVLTYATRDFNRFGHKPIPANRRTDG